MSLPGLFHCLVPDVFSEAMLNLSPGYFVVIFGVSYDLVIYDTTSDTPHFDAIILSE